MKHSFLKRFSCFILSVTMLVAAPLSASALSLDDFSEALDHKLDLIEYYEETAKQHIEHNFDLFEELFHNNNPFEFWWDVFKTTPSSSEISSGSSSSSSSSAHFIPDPEQSRIYYSTLRGTADPEDILYIVNEINSVYNLGNNWCSFGYDYGDGSEAPYYIIFFPDYTSDCKVYAHRWFSRIYLQGPYSGPVYLFRFQCHGTGEYYDDESDYHYKWSWFLDDDFTCDLDSGESEELRYFDSDHEFYISTIPCYYMPNDELFSPADPTDDSWGHDFTIHSPITGRWSDTSDTYILDLFVYYTGDNPDFDPGDYVASGGLVYIDPSTNTRYLPWSDYVFFDSIADGKISTMSNPGTVFHMHLDKIKDTIYRHRIGFGDWYAFVRVSDSDGETVYYAQQAINFNDVDSGVFSGTADFPDWDDYEPEFDDDSSVPTVTINNYNDYSQFETAPNSFDFDAYAEWMYTNLSILNDNVGTLNDNLVLFFDSWADFASDFYTFFTNKFNMIADHIDDTVDALARYIKDINAVSVFNTNVIADNLLDELKSALVPDADVLTAFFYLGCPWYKQISDMFDFLSGYGTSFNFHHPELTFSLPYYYFTTAHEGDNLLFHDYTLDLGFLQNETLYSALTMLVRAATCFTCFRIGMSMFGVGVFKEVEAGDV